MENDTPATQPSQQNLPPEGAHVTGNVNTEGGDFVGHDKIIHGDEVRGPKIEKGGMAVVATGVSLTGVRAGGDIHIHDIYAGITYQNVLPRPVDAAMLQSATAKLAELPLDHIPPATPLPTGSRMPLSVNPLFVGREAALLKLAATLKGGETVAVSQIAAVTGLGGLGKTQLAVAFVHLYGQFFLGGVAWLNCADPNAIAAEIVNCGSAMPDIRADFATLDLETQVRLVLAAWQNPLPRLLVFDNCEEPALLTKWRPTTGGSRVLVTSRRSTWDAALGVSVVPLETLTRAQSIELLHKFRPDLAATAPELDQIAAELGDLPLALHLAGSYLARYRLAVSPAQYLKQLQQPTLLQHRSLQAGDLSPTSHAQHVARTFALSYEQLKPTEPTDALARALLARVAWFAPGQLIPRALLLASIELADEEQALQAADALQHLTDLGLVEMDAIGDLRMHRLVAHFVQEADPAAAQVAQSAVAAALLAAADRLNSAGVPGPLLVWQSHLRHIIQAVKNQSDEQAAGLCNTLGAHLRMIGDYAAAKPYLERALAIQESVLGQQHPDTATSYNNLGLLLREMGELAAAKPYLERSLAICQEVLGAKHPSTSLSLNNLGSLLQAQGDYVAAKPYYERSLAICEEVLGAKHPDTARSLNNLGALLQAQGDYAAARPYFERTLAIYEEVLGAKHPDTASSLNNLGALLHAQGDYAAARPYYERALAIYEEVLGAKHPDTASSLNNLGAVLGSMGDYAAARPYYERALTIRQEMLGTKHPDTARSLNNLGYLLHAQGDYAAARPYYERALTIRQEVLGTKHPDTVQSLNNLGALLQAQGDYAAARPYYERALAINEEVLGVKHPDTALSLNNLGYLLHAQGDYAAARPYYERALAIRQEVLGAKHPNTAQSLNNLGALLHAQGDYAAARPYYERALAINEEVLGAKHPDTASSLNNLGYLLRTQGDYAGARPYYERALAIRQEVLGAKHPDTALSLNNLGALLQAQGDYAAARPYFEQALAIFEASLGPAHAYTKMVQNNLADLERRMKSKIHLLKQFLSKFLR